MPCKIDLLNRTLQLASSGLGQVSPNPLLGWVLVSTHSEIMAEGWAPQKPLLSIDFIGESKGSSTLYVNSLYDTEPKLFQTLSNFGINKICSAGPISAPFQQKLPASITWKDNLLPKVEAFFNRRYLSFSSQKRPYIILKWAETKDSFVARKNYDSKWISNTHSRRLVHKWRAEEDAILVGTNTAHYDNPKLNVRMWSGRNPVRIVIDKHLRLDKNLSLFDGSQPTLCYNSQIDQTQENLTWVNIPASNNQLGFFSRMLQDLWQRDVQSVIIEGGAQLLHFLIEHQLWDEARVFTSTKTFEKGIAAPKIDPQLLAETSFISDDILRIYHNTRS
jgi:diaminohydroxyphosphoribosylaminopyrimidine deaminase/5-amino-6-(5-phosphoribosylamino)uracil reductase